MADILLVPMSATNLPNGYTQVSAIMKGLKVKELSNKQKRQDAFSCNPAFVV